jgi:isopentenyl phosphate kinase
VIFITDVAGVYTSDPKSNGDAELIRCIQVDGDTGALSIERECDGDGDGDDGTRGRSEADGMNVTGSSHAHDVTGGLKVRPLFSPNLVPGRFFYRFFRHLSP